MLPPTRRCRSFLFRRKGAKLTTGDRAADNAPRPSNGVTAADRTGLLIIRAWVEQGSSEPLRAQIRVSADVSVGFDRTLTLLRSQDVCAAVQMWLDGILREAER